MHRIYRYFFVILIISFSYSYASEKHTKCLNGQQNSYHSDDIKKTVYDGLLQAQSAYENKNYQEASVLAKGSLEYSVVMNKNVESAYKNVMQFIIADCHLNHLHSPQHAFEELNNVCDIQTPYGTLTAEHIATQLKIIAQEKPTLSKKLLPQIHKYEALSYNQYKNTYHNQSIENILLSLKRGQSLIEQHVLISMIEHHALAGNMKLQALLASIYHSGLYNRVACPEKSLNFIEMYTQRLAHVETIADLPFERFAIKNLYKKNNDTFNDHHKVMHLYYQYFDAALNNDSQKTNILTQLYSINDMQSPLRQCALRCINSKSKKIQYILKDWFKFESQPNFEEMLTKLIQSDGDYIIPLLEKEAIKNNTRPQASYIIGLLYYHKHDYKNAFSWFKNSHPYNSDLPTQCKTLVAYLTTITSWSYENVQEVINFFNIFFLEKKQNNRNKKNIPQAVSLLSEHALTCATIALQNDGYTRALALANYCVKYPETYALGLHITTLTNDALAHKGRPLTVTQFPAFYHIVQHWNEHHDKESLICLSPIITYKTLLKETTTNISVLLQAQALEHALNHYEYTQKEQLILKQSCASAYYQLSKENKEKRSEYLSKAAELNHDQALLELADLQMNQVEKIEYDVFSKMLLTMRVTSYRPFMYTSDKITPENMKLLQKVEQLAHNKHAGKNIRAQAFEFLAYLKYTIVEDENNNPRVKRLDPLITAQYIATAHELGSTKNLDRMAEYYTTGVKDPATHAWIIEPSLEKARIIREKIFNKEKTILTQYDLAVAYFLCQEQYTQKAFQLFKDIVQKAKSQYEIQTVSSLMYLCAISLNNLAPENILKAYTYVQQARKMVGQREIENFLAKAIDPDLYKKLSHYVSCLLEKKNNKEFALRAYELFSFTFYGYQALFPKNNVDETLLHTCLIFAAQNHSIQAKVAIVNRNVPGVHNWTKIQYLNDIAASLSNPSADQVKNIDILMKQYCPKSLHDQAAYIEYLTQERKTAYLLDYLGSDYFDPIPNNSDPLFTINDITLAKTYCQNNAMKRCLQEFNKCYENKMAINKIVLNSVLTYIYAAMNSDEKTLILQGAAYSEKCLQLTIFNNFPELRYILALCYYKLAKLASKSLLSSEYLKKARVYDDANFSAGTRLSTTELQDQATFLLAIRNGKQK